MLRRLLVILLTLTLVLMVLPVIARGALPRGPRVLRHTLFFGCLGFGFMFVEIPLLQRLPLYLGHPSYATTVVLGSLLVGAGVGASLTGRIPYWAINGATSLLGSVMALVIALVAGFTVVVTGAVALYVLAALLVPTRRAA